MSKIKAIRPTRKNISKSNNKTLEEITNQIKSGEVLEVEIASIKPPKYHDRKYIDKTSIYELSESIKSEGLIYPIVLRELEDGTLERMIGYRRLEATKLLKRKTIKAIVLKNISDAKALLLMTTENIQRVDLSIYDETLALFDYISVSLGMTTEETMKLFNRYKNYTTGAIELTDEELNKYETVEDILSKTGKISIGGMINRLNMISFKEPIKNELSKGTLSFSNAKILNKINDETVLKEAINTVIENKYSKRETSKYVAGLLPQKSEKNASILKKVSKINLSKLDEEKKTKIESLLQQILKISES